MCDPHCDRFLAVQYTQLADDIAEVKIDGALSDLELHSDVVAGHATSREAEALVFTGRQRTALVNRRDALLDHFFHEDVMED